MCRRSDETYQIHFSKSRTKGILTSSKGLWKETESSKEMRASTPKTAHSG
jgi:hypothetical protein